MEIKHIRTYKIMYCNNEMSDIDMFEIECELQRTEYYYYTELYITSHMGNIIKYTTEKQAAGEFDMNSFCRDTDAINELRSWLWEGHDSKPTDFTSAELRHKTILDELDNLVEEYCKKYGFTYDV